MKMKLMMIVMAMLLAGANLVNAQTWNGAGGKIWTQPDSDDFSPEYTSGATATFAGAGETVTIDAGGVTPGGVIVNNTGTYYFRGGSIGGTGSLTKTNSGTLIITNANSFSGGIFLNSGKLQLNTGSTAASLGDPANVVTFTGSSTFDVQQVNQTLSNAFVVNGVTASLAGNHGRQVTVNNSLTGSGAVNVSGSGNLTFDFKSTNNTFSGDFTVSAGTSGYVGHLRMDSLTDTPGRRMALGGTDRPGIFTYGTGAVVPLVLSNRRIQMSGTTAGGTFNNNATNANATVTINTDLAITGTGNKTFTLGGSHTNNNIFAGAITNGAGSVISLTKADAGKWILTGANTYSGTTTIADGTLEFASRGTYAGNISVTDTTPSPLTFSGAYTQTVSGVISGSMELIKDGAGTLSLTGANTYTSNTTVNAGILSLGNGTSSSSLYDFSTLSVASGAKMNLNYTGSDKVFYLNLGGSPAAKGTWGAIGSVADNTSPYFTGTGVIDNLAGDTTALNIAFWDGGTSDIGTAGNAVSAGGAGTWNTTLKNWDYGYTAHAAWANTNSGIAIFAGTVGTVTLGEAITLSNLTITANSPTYTIRSNTLNFATGGRITVNSSQNGNWATVTTISSAISNAPAVALNTAGVNAETVFAPVSGTSSLGTISGGGLLQLGGSTTGNTVSGTGANKIRVTGGEWTLLGNAYAYQHWVNFGTLIVNAGGVLSASDAKGINLSTNATLVANGTVGSGTASGVLFTGSTEGASPWNVARPGGTLKGTGVVNQTVALTVVAGATIAPGYPTGTLTITNCACTINGKLAITINGGQVSKLAMASAQTLTISSATLDVNMLARPISPVTIATYGSGKLTGTFASNNLPTGWTINYGDNAIVLTPPAAGTLITIL